MTVATTLLLCLQLGTAQHSTVQHGTAQHGTARHGTTEPPTEDVSEAGAAGALSAA